MRPLRSGGDLSLARRSGRRARRARTPYAPSADRGVDPQGQRLGEWRPVRSASNRSQPGMGLKRFSTVRANWLTAVSPSPTVRAASAISAAWTLRSVAVTALRSFHDQKFIVWPTAGIEPAQLGVAGHRIVRLHRHLSALRQEATTAEQVRRGAMAARGDRSALPGVHRDIDAGAARQ